MVANFCHVGLPRLRRTSEWRAAFLGSQATTRVIGSVKALYLGRSHEVVSWIGPRSRKILVLVCTLLFSVVVLVTFAAGKAWAQPSVEPYAAAADGTLAAAGGTSGPVAKTLPATTPSTERPHAEASVVDKAPWVNTPPADPMSSGNQPDTLASMPGPAPRSDPAPVPSERYDDKMPVGPTVEPGTPGPESKPVPSLGPEVPAPLIQPAPATPEPATFEKNEPLPARAGERSLAGTPVTGVRSVALPENKPAGAAPIGAPASTVVQNTPATEPTVPRLTAGSRPPSSLGASVSSAVETLQSAAANTTVGVWNTLTGRSSLKLSSRVPPALTEEEPSEDTPQPFSPSVPLLAGSYFSLYGGGQESPPISTVPLLLCVLASALILLRRDGPLSWASCELPKPSSALLLPLERPG
jgi:hypothetical protein